MAKEIEVKTTEQLLVETIEKNLKLTEKLEEAQRLHTENVRINKANKDEYERKLSSMEKEYELLKCRIVDNYHRKTVIPLKKEIEDIKKSKEVNKLTLEELTMTIDSSDDVIIHNEGRLIGDLNKLDFLDLIKALCNVTRTANEID